MGNLLGARECRPSPIWDRRQTYKNLAAPAPLLHLNPHHLPPPTSPPPAPTSLALQPRRPRRLDLLRLPSMSPLSVVLHAVEPLDHPTSTSTSKATATPWGFLPNCLPHSLSPTSPAHRRSSAAIGPMQYVFNRDGTLLTLPFNTGHKKLLRFNSSFNSFRYKNVCMHGESDLEFAAPQHRNYDCMDFGISDSAHTPSRTERPFGSPAQPQAPRKAETMPDLAGRFPVAPQGRNYARTNFEPRAQTPSCPERPNYGRTNLDSRADSWLPRKAETMPGQILDSHAHSQLMQEAEAMPVRILDSRARSTARNAETMNP
ncbi:hypothetical protein B0H17DRAFT_1210239 [Mycena rosella]|uniref:Uncharacterized protein n=1 Tax=Mycena rosella TaxID=1033263 RepID=A0AAD7CX80_MYCRO|nr:hypothetical protein B0H17DRAFT_1210239 [Mycena rosella]